MILNFFQSGYNKPQLPDDVFLEIRRLVELKRRGRHHDAEEGYRQYADKLIGNTSDFVYAHILKGWAKIKICLGEYEEAIDMLNQAARLFKSVDEEEAFQCSSQATILMRRDTYRNQFIAYVKAASGGSIDYPKNY
ncbi:MAG: tetratricopeptide repeat protein [Candidatus Cloacimonetes bacterium]|jgi:tetratricopeptide (TPR) repeat protein|nr:tetratricopeptide repeat protein [Candidatus Cloacimonadota bacterium]